MIDPYIQDWLDIIENMKNTNTYKLSWGRAILECLSFSDYQKEDKQIVVSFKSIASCMLKYYWNELQFANQNDLVDRFYREFQL
ncbi:MAG: hypothetical protein WCR56_00545 [Bacilli bacterium]|jgi:hypothetical protein